MQQLSQKLICGLFIDVMEWTAVPIKQRGMSAVSASVLRSIYSCGQLGSAAVCIKVIHSISLTLTTVFT